MSVIHRRGLTDKAYCGATPDAFGHLKLSDTGVVVTCPDCAGPSREEQRPVILAAIKRAAERYRKEGNQHD